MNTRLLRTKIINALFILSIVLLSLGASTVNATSASHSTSWVDDYDSATLDSRWTWVREDPTHWSLTDQPGYLRIVTQEGGIFQDGNEGRNILLTPAPSEDFRIITKVTFSPTENYQAASLFVYQDDDNYITLDRGYADGDKVRFRHEVGAVMTSTLTIDEPATNLYLRIDKKGDSYLGFYSLDAVDWTFVGQHDAALLSPKVGISAAHGPALAEINADFDFFKLEPLPVFNAVWRDDFDETNLDSAWMWVREDPTHWSLTEQPGYLHIVTQPGGLFGSENSLKNLLITTPSSDNFRITTKVTITPTENYQGASLYVYQDDDNYLRVSRRYSGGDSVEIRYESGGEIDTSYGESESATTILLRIEKEGDAYLTSYSVDGSNWTYLGEVGATLLSPKVGIAASSSISEVEIDADFDFFELEYTAFKIFLPLTLRSP